MVKKNLLTLLFLCLCLTPALAESPSDTTDRIQWIQTQLDRAAASSNTWQYAWSTAYGAMTYLYSAQAVTLDDDDQDDDRFDSQVNAITSFLGFASMLADPLLTPKPVNALKKLPASTEQEKKAALGEWENLLRRSALREKRGRSWKTHALAGIVSVAAGVAVACDGSRKGDGVVMFAGSLLVSEIQIFTQPTKAYNAWKAYQNGSWSQTNAFGKPRNKFFVSVLPRGVTLTYRF